MISVDKRHPQYLSHSERRQCGRLTLGSKGDMLNVLMRKAWVVPGLYTYYLCKQNNVVLGWAILTRRLNGDWEVDVYVDKNARRCGIGKSLIRAIRQNVPIEPIYAYPYDDVGRRFFDNNGFDTTREWDGGDVRLDAV